MNVLEISNLTKAFGGLKALERISLSVQPGEIFRFRIRYL